MNVASETLSLILSKTEIFLTYNLKAYAIKSKTDNKKNARKDSGIAKNSRWCDMGINKEFAIKSYLFRRDEKYTCRGKTSGETSTR